MLGAFNLGGTTSIVSALSGQVDLKKDFHHHGGGVRGYPLTSHGESRQVTPVVIGPQCKRVEMRPAASAKAAELAQSRSDII